MFKIISYYTPTYKDTAEKYLIKSVNKLDLPHYIEELGWEEDWKFNTDYKPKFIRKCLSIFGEDLVFVDCDAEILSYPTLFEEIPKEYDYDIALHNLSWEEHYGRPTDKNKFEILSGTIWFNNRSSKVKPLVDKWISECPGFAWEQMALDFVLNPIINTYYLPREYCYILTQPSGKPPAVPIDKPVIVHHQIGRILSRLV